MKSQPSPSAGRGPQVILLLVALLILIGLGYLAWRYANTSPETAATNPSGDVVVENGMLYGGLPRAEAPEAQYEILRNEAYVVGYSEQRKDPLWVAYHLLAMGPEPHLPRPRGFLPDDRTTADVRSEEYNRSGYDRGHMCPNHAIAVHFGVEAQEETFLMSNVVPQKHALNAGVWEDLERQESDIYPNEFHEVWVIDGPVFHEPAPTLRSGVAVPDACYKILIRSDGGHPHVLPVIMPQEVHNDHVIDHYLTTVGEIENQTHLHFFTGLSDQARKDLEEERPRGKW